MGKIGRSGMADALDNMIRLHSTYQDIFRIYILRILSVYLIRLIGFSYIV